MPFPKQKFHYHISSCNSPLQSYVIDRISIIRKASSVINQDIESGKVICSPDINQRWIAHRKNIFSFQEITQEFFAKWRLGLIQPYSIMISRAQNNIDLFRDPFKQLA